MVTLTMSGALLPPAAHAQEITTADPTAASVSIQYDGTKLETSVSLGGGTTVKVLLDTGSFGLIVKSGAIGADQAPTSLPPQEKCYGGNFCVTGDVVDTTVALTASDGSRISTPPIHVASIPSGQTTPSYWDAAGVVGIMGIGVGIDTAPGENTTAAPNVMSPIAQLAAPYSNGYQINTNSTGGWLRLGTPVRQTGSIVFPLNPEPWTLPNGVPAWKKGTQLCWTAGSAHTCGWTLLDTGAPNGTVSDVLMPYAPNEAGHITSGTKVTIAAPDAYGGQSLYSNTVNKDGYYPNYRDDSGSRDSNWNNSGTRFFWANTVGYDAIAGQAILTHK